MKWESNAVPDSERPPQASLNAQVVDDSDFGIAVFWSRIGTPTDAADSGSVEEVRRLSERGARVLVYFGTAAVPQSELVDDQFKRLQEFKEGFRKRAFVSTYEDPNDSSFSGETSSRPTVIMPSAQAAVKRGGGAGRTSVSQSLGPTGHSVRRTFAEGSRTWAQSANFSRKMARPAGLEPATIGLEGRKCCYPE